MTQTNRLQGGQIDHTKTLRFQWNERWLSAHPGDTLASALLANNIRLVGRSFKYHRPRGIFTAGSEEPNALVQIGKGAALDPNTRATTVEMREGLYARSQNHVGPLAWDRMAIADYLHPFLAAGFYYKTFMWPKAFWEKLYEPAIRRAAGLGALSGKPDPDAYDHGYLHADLLIIGAGPAGLAAALTAGRSGLRVILADEDFNMGGRLNAETYEVENQPGATWAEATVTELATLPNIRLSPRTTIFGAYDHGIYGALERNTGKTRQTLWRIYTKHALLTAGATERPIAFGNNDRPGILQASALRTYLNRFAATPGHRIAIFTNNDDGLRTAEDARAKGLEVARIVDTRKGETITDTKGRLGIRSVTLNTGQRIEVDCLAVSGGWSPNVHLTCHHRSRPVWTDAIAAFTPGPNLPQGMAVAGAANGTLTLAATLAEGHAKAAEITETLGKTPKGTAPKASDEPADITPFWHVAESKPRAWVDLQNDVTTKDIRQSHAEGFRSVEHLKRYTTLGMATDQGKTSNTLGLALLAEASGKSIPETGTTIFRPPYTPVPMAAFAGRARAEHFRPTRLTPSHQWAMENGASFTEAGLWLRAEWYAQPGEKGWRDSVDREVIATRQSLGIADVSTLGKIDIQGRDAADFLNRVYSNPFLKLPVGKVRYGLMLREDGFAYDDGTTARMSETHFIMTTTTTNAGLVYRNLEFARQCLWPDLDVHLQSITDAWAQYSIAGPNARALLSEVVDNLDLSNAAFPFMACTECTIFGGTPARLFRISFSGELAYELAVPSRTGDALIRALMEAGKPYDITPYGLEALNVMRIEKGHVTSAELNGQTTSEMAGLGGMVSAKKDAIGIPLTHRPALTTREQIRLVGLRPVGSSATFEAGAHLLAKDAPNNLLHDQGWITSVAHSPTLGHHIGLGYLKRGATRHGEILRAHDPVRGQDVEVEICSPHHYDPEGARQRA
ncbi:MAG: sarcosine oxidase subunit alpha family protein [Pseudomonadota bacterium]